MQREPGPSNRERLRNGNLDGDPAGADRVPYRLDRRHPAGGATISHARLLLETLNKPAGSPPHALVSSATDRHHAHIVFLLSRADVGDDGLDDRFHQSI